MKITFVKKILASGEPCAKCADVQAKLEQGNHLARIDATLIADERDPSSPGMRLAELHKVDRAPFFVVEDGEKTTVYTVYLKFVKEVLGAQTKPAETAKEVLRANPDLDYI